MKLEKEPSSKGLSWALTIAGAIVVATVQEDGSGLLVGGVLGFLLAQVLHLRDRVRDLHRQIQLSRLQRDSEPSVPRASHEVVTRPLAPPTAAAPTPSPAQPPRPSTPGPIESAPAPVAAQRVPEARQSSPRAARPAPPEPTVFDRAIGNAIAWLKGGNSLARAGIVILFFGAAFLAKYAAEHSLFPIELRFICIALGALALLVIGWRLRSKRPGYAQLLQGGGIAGLYLTVFAAMKLYQMLPAGLAFGLMIAIVLAAAVLAVGQNAISLAVIGTAGGFLAPILVSTGSGNHIALFTYYAVLNLGVLTIAWYRTWRELNVLGFVFTFGITALWRVSGYEAADLVSADAFLILFFLMYVAVSILNCVRQPPDLKGYVSGSLVFGLPIVAFALHASIISRIEYGLAWSALALGAFYLALGWALLRTRRDTFRLLIESFAALGVIFASLAIPLAFDAQTTAAMWAVEGAGLLWLGLRQQRPLPRVFGVLLQLGAGLSFLSTFDRIHPERFVVNAAYLGTLMLSLSALASSYWLHRDRQRLANYEQGSAQLFALWGVAWWLFGGLYQIDEFLDPAALGASLLYVSLTAAALAFLGHRRDWMPALAIAWWLPAVVGIVALGYLADVRHPLAEYGVLGWVAAFAVQYGLLYAADQYEQYNAPAKTLLHAGTCWLLILLIAIEASWQLSRHVGGVWPALPWGLLPAFTLAFLSRAVPRPAWPVARHLRSYRFVAAVPLAILCALWIVGVNLTDDGDPVWLPYIPLLNPQDVSVALCLVSLVVWWTSLEDAQRAHLQSIDPRLPYALIAALTFLWLNAALIRALHYAVDTPLTLTGIASSTIVQAALSIFWGVLGFAAMTFAARTKRRILWLIGATLMAVVVVKLFLVDLSSTGTIARIASFISVGLLLLVTGYLAPLPPRRADEGTPNAA